MIKAALFDMDGTLYDTERFSTEAWQAACRQYGLDISDEQTYRFHGRSARDNAVSFAEMFGSDAPYWDIREVRYAHMSERIREEGVPVKPGVFELFQVLRDKNIRIVVATGTARDIAEGYWRDTGVDRWLYASVCGSESGKSKPDPEIFLRAAAAAGADPGECVVFEDSRVGILGAKAAGCMAVMIPDQEQPSEDVRAAADLILDSLTEMTEIVRGWPDAPAADQG